MNVKNQLIRVLVRKVKFGILVHVIVSVTKRVKLVSIYILKIVSVKRVL